MLLHVPETPQANYATPAESVMSSTTKTDAALCRICLDDSQEYSRLICPCNCKGSVARTHSACLEKMVGSEAVVK
ncbi:hypothetical protein Q1695_003230 [Nippostrongylus brasiliensis]|nr:hypothetical protein Q1695_003230 [Nippostrongylus brasiliensis]